MLNEGSRLVSPSKNSTKNDTIFTGLPPTSKRRRSNNTDHDQIDNMEWKMDSFHIDHSTEAKIADSSQTSLMSIAGSGILMRDATADIYANNRNGSSGQDLAAWWHPDNDERTATWKTRSSTIQISDTNSYTPLFTSNHNDGGRNDSDDSRSSHSSEGMLIHIDAPFVEGRYGEVVIPDISPEVMNELLLFIYTDACSSVGILENMAIDLFSASAKYQITSLFNFIEDYLCLQITTESCLGLFQLADMYNADKLH